MPISTVRYFAFVDKTFRIRLVNKNPMVLKYEADTLPPNLENFQGSAINVSEKFT